MVKIILVGCNGRMGSFITENIENRDDMQIVAGVDTYLEVKRSYKTYANIADVPAIADVIVDFSNPDAFKSVTEYSRKNKIPLVVGTTGLNEKQQEEVKSLSKDVAVFSSFNMSLGINLLIGLAKKATEILGDSFDIEIIEQHHNQKLDAPSGTAYMLANAINEVKNNKMQYNYDRHSTRAKRDKNEIGIHSVRGGNIVGEHEVIFAGNDEVIKISHSAHSKQVFALGAVNAARFLSGKAPGLYDMKDIIK